MRRPLPDRAVTARIYLGIFGRYCPMLCFSNCWTITGVYPVRLPLPHRAVTARIDLGMLALAPNAFQKKVKP